MVHTRQSGWGWLVFGVLAAVSVIGLRPLPGFRLTLGPSATVAVGRPAPPITVRTLTGQPWHLTPGRPLMVNFWASWCEFCQVEAPAVAEMGARADGQYQVVTVDITAHDSVTAARQFAARYHLAAPVLLDSSGAIQRAYQVTVLPTTFYINRQGRIVAIVYGAETYAAMKAHIQEAARS
ncbi:Thioredoxin [Sulfobacillus acidophilus TPY]|uniref:Alkyl hydroperoxide reductase/ Thiol specific antioxidant/ Mal allergen n=1 Tax=Sulfobacillus acidophilus (strain ATCC 700253 / DSM 10332 / NAL) TaxID=679936 RepID=G8TXZ7_SULAD|nr:Thioredoxin [Sulfobacillus acidophilus TPY]AEW06203.1 alkyl hydroperoxide reductase/ Thiol specific antioxidant/ Mal allergen [Sulfobacillus acidophilus DSM 10332]